MIRKISSGIFLLFSALFFVALSGTNDGDQSDQGEGKTLIRIKNDSWHEIHEVKVQRNRHDRVKYGDIASGEYSQYKEIDSAYRTLPVLFEVNGYPVGYTPECQVGEEPMEPGRYTYIVSCCDSTVKATISSLSSEEDPVQQVEHVSADLTTVREVDDGKNDTLFPTQF